MSHKQQKSNKYTILTTIVIVTTRHDLVHSTTKDSSHQNCSSVRRGAVLRRPMCVTHTRDSRRRTASSGLSRPAEPRRHRTPFEQPRQNPAARAWMCSSGHTDPVFSSCRCNKKCLCSGDSSWVCSWWRYDWSAQCRVPVDWCTPCTRPPPRTRAWCRV